MNERAIARDVARVPADPANAPASRAIGRCAIHALYRELALHPKPGLVSFVDAGSHADMDARTFMRSLFALRGYFVRIAELGARQAGFDALERAGRIAETRMLAATGGINTHRGAVFSLGLLCAASGASIARRGAVDAASIRAALNTHWGEALDARAARRRAGDPLAGASRLTHGQRARARYGLRNASDEAALGFPAVFEIAIPALRAARAAGLDDDAACLQTLFAIIAVLADTNLAHRGGPAGLAFAQSQAQGFLRAGGCARSDWRTHTLRMHASFVERRLSPGGAADVLAAAWFVDRVASMFDGVCA